MTQAKGHVDKNLQGIAEDLARQTVNSHQAQQLQQDKNDRRHQDALNHDKPVDLEQP